MVRVELQIVAVAFYLDVVATPTRIDQRGNQPFRQSADIDFPDICTRLQQSFVHACQYHEPILSFTQSRSSLASVNPALLKFQKCGRHLNHVLHAVAYLVHEQFAVSRSLFQL